MIAERPSRVSSKAVVYVHPVYGPLAGLTDPAIDFYAVARVASPDAADLEGRLRRFVEDVWRWEASGASKLDPAWLQTGSGRVSRYDVRETKRHKGDHSDNPGPAAEPDEADTPPSILRYQQVVDRLLTTRELTEDHLRMLELRWQQGRELERPDDAANAPAFTGQARSTRKLTIDDARAIRASRHSDYAEAKARNVTPATIRRIRTHEVYRDVDPDQTVAGQLQITNVRARRMWAEVTTRLWFELYP